MKALRGGEQKWMEWEGKEGGRREEGGRVERERKKEGGEKPEATETCSI